MTDELPEITDQFRHALHQVVRRSLIDTTLQETPNNTALSVVKRMVREKESVAQIAGKLDTLVSSEFLVDPEKAEVAKELSEKLRRRFSNIPGLAVVLLGSSLHGGTVISKILGNDERVSDFDWGTIHSSKSKLDMSRLADEGGEIIKEVGRNRGLVLEACTYVNPERFNARNLSDIRHASKLLSPDQIKKDWFLNKLYLYLEPSFPSETNGKNRNLILKALSELARVDKSRWEEVVETMIAGWRRIHNLKVKHLVSKTDFSPKSEKIADRATVRCWNEYCF